MISISSSTKFRHRKIIKLARGFVGSQSKLYKIANQRVMKSYKYSFMHRKKLKRDFKKLWIIRLNAFCKLNHTTYNRMKNFLSLNKIIINSKILGNLLLFDKDLILFFVKKF